MENFVSLVKFKKSSTARSVIMSNAHVIAAIVYSVKNLR